MYHPRPEGVRHVDTWFDREHRLVVSYILGGGPWVNCRGSTGTKPEWRITFLGGQVRKTVNLIGASRCQGEGTVDRHINRYNSLISTNNAEKSENSHLQNKTKKEEESET